eukprot:scaffold8288_cov129-Cylindrotheca_fusiformis.AAC.5
MQGICNCGEERAVEDMFDEEENDLVVPMKPYGIESSSRGDLEEEIQEEENREETEEDDIKLIKNRTQGPGGRDTAGLKEERDTKEPVHQKDNKKAVHQTKEKKSKFRFGRRRKLKRKKSQRKSIASLKSFVEEVLGTTPPTTAATTTTATATTTTAREMTKPEDNWVITQWDSFDEVGEDESFFAMLLRDMDNGNDDAKEQEEHHPKDESSLCSDSTIVLDDTATVIEVQESMTIEAIYEPQDKDDNDDGRDGPCLDDSQEEKDTKTSTPRLFHIQLPTLFFSKRGQQLKKSKQPSKKEQAIQTSEDDWPVDTDLVLLLEKACRRIGRANKNKVDVMPYIINLRRASYDDVGSLKGKSVHWLEHYMPRSVAIEVVQLLQQEMDEEEFCTINNAEGQLMKADEDDETKDDEVWASIDSTGWSNQMGEIVLFGAAE